MTRGNQRDLARERTQAKLAAQKTKKTGNPQQRREADAKALQDAIAAKAARKEAEAANGGAKTGKTEKKK